ncbi:MAG TPA: ribonuclease HII [Eubacteriaceae bacterium]|nr:ribonuclease HII [Eubacteriaceae bacterium]
MSTKNKSIAQLKEMVSKAKEAQEIHLLIEHLKIDPRKGANRLATQLERQLEKQEKRWNRFQQMRDIEEKYLTQGYQHIAGMDEVGRGPLAGPVVSAAVVFPKEFSLHREALLDVDDSKKLSAAKREDLYDKILEACVECQVVFIDNTVIDRFNIYNATIQSMTKAVRQLSVEPDLLLIDAMHLPDLSMEQKSVVKGDQRIFSIAAASIVAKVKRDAYMEQYHYQYPQYDFLNNKGYGTKTHIEAIQKYGLTPIHRRSFCKNFMK